MKRHPAECPSSEELMKMQLAVVGRPTEQVPFDWTNSIRVKLGAVFVVDDVVHVKRLSKEVKWQIERRGFMAK